jgi:hypothetical protein
MALHFGTTHWHAICSIRSAAAAVAQRSEYGAETVSGPPRADLVRLLFTTDASGALAAVDAAELAGPELCPGRVSQEQYSSLTSNGGDTMVAINRKRIHCVVIAVPAEAEAWLQRGALAHELVPGADPYVAQLIQRLQDEVRHERQLEQLHRRKSRVIAKPRFAQRQLVGDLEIPWFDMPLEDEPLGEEGVPDLGGDS